MIEDVVIRMGMDARPVSAALRGVRKDFADFKDHLEGFDLGGMIKGGLAAVGIGLSVGALAEAAKGAIDYAHELGNLEEELGMSASSLQAFSLKVARTGGDSEIAIKALEKLSVKIGEARQGNDEAAESFQRLGISLKNADGSAKPTEKVLGEIADKFKAIQDPTARAALAFDLFGKSGVKVANALKDGAKGLEDFKKAASGKILSDADVHQLEELKKYTTGFGKRVISYAGKALAGITDPGGVSRMLREQQLAAERAEGGNDTEAKAERGKKALEAMAKLEKARRDMKFDGLRTEDKVLFLQREQTELQEQINKAEDGSAEKIDLQTKYLEKEKEIREAQGKLLKEHDEAHKKLLETQKQKTEEARKEAQVMREVRREVESVNHAHQELREAKADRTRFTLEDLANTGIDGYTTGDAAQQIWQARQAVFLQNRAAWEAKHGWNKDAAADMSKADEIRKGLSMLTAQEQNPFKSLEESAKKQEEALNDLLEKADGEGIHVILANGD